jgi:hypothetical protein
MYLAPRPRSQWKPGATPQDFRAYHDPALKARLNEFVFHANESRFQR